jgi:hypothetical protein
VVLLCARSTKGKAIALLIIIKLMQTRAGRWLLAALLPFFIAGFIMTLTKG